MDNSKADGAEESKVGVHASSDPDLREFEELIQINEALYAHPADLTWRLKLIEHAARDLLRDATEFSRPLFLVIEQGIRDLRRGSVTLGSPQVEDEVRRDIAARHNAALSAISELSDVGGLKNADLFRVHLAFERAARHTTAATSDDETAPPFSVAEAAKILLTEVVSDLNALLKRSGASGCPVQPAEIERVIEAYQPHCHDRMLRRWGGEWSDLGTRGRGRGASAAHARAPDEQQLPGTKEAYVEALSEFLGREPGGVARALSAARASYEQRLRRLGFIQNSE